MNYQEHIHLIEYHCRGKDDLSGTPHRDDSIEIVQFWSDGGYFIVRNHIFQIKPRSVLIVDAMETHYSHPADPENYERSKIVISRDFFRIICEFCGIEADSLSAILQNGAAFYNCNNITNWILSVDGHFKDAAWHFENLGAPFSQLGIVSSIISILDTIFPRLDAAESQETASTIDLLANYLNSNGNDWQNISMEKMCKSLHISSSYASHLFKELTGKSLIQYITMLRMTEAKRLLLYSNSKIKDISAVLSFDNTTTFCRYFKKHVGCTPQEYRKSGGISIASLDL